MGKRKLLGTTFYQCDWTGYAMRQPFCFMPSWGENGKLVKKGSYCNWEAVVAHANWLQEKGTLAADDHSKLMHYVEKMCGTTPCAAPHYEELAHTKGTLREAEFHAACTRQHEPITSLLLKPDCTTEVLLAPNSCGEFDFDLALSGEGTLTTFHSTRKKGAKSERELTVLYYPQKDKPYNATASNIFKLQIYGDVLLVGQSRENCFMSRERYVSFTQAMFEDLYSRKRKRADTASISVDEYKELKLGMQAKLDGFEQTVSKEALPPQEVSKVQRSQTCGSSLGSALKARGQAPPPPVQRQTATVH